MLSPCVFSATCPWRIHCETPDRKSEFDFSVTKLRMGSPELRPSDASMDLLSDVRPLLSKVYINKTHYRFRCCSQSDLLLYGRRDSLRAMSGDSFLSLGVSRNSGPCDGRGRVTMPRPCTFASGSASGVFVLPKKVRTHVIIVMTNGHPRRGRDSHRLPLFSGRGRDVGIPL